MLYDVIRFVFLITRVEASCQYTTQEWLANFNEWLRPTPPFHEDLIAIVGKKDAWAQEGRSLLSRTSIVERMPDATACMKFCSKSTSCIGYVVNEDWTAKGPNCWMIPVTSTRNPKDPAVPRTQDRLPEALQAY